MVFNVNGLRQVTGVCTMKSSESESLHNNLQLNGAQPHKVLNLNFFILNCTQPQILILI